jgi:phosphonate transport system substrate-binding protein
VKLLHSTQQSSRPFYSLLLLLVLGLILLVSACGTGPSRTTSATPTLTMTATLPPTLTPTPVPLGRPENPFVIGLVSETEDPQIEAAANELALQIANLSGLSVRGMVYPSYQALLDDLSFGKVHIAWLPPLTYLFASQSGLAEVALLTNHFGVYEYGTQFLANIESMFVPYHDPISGLNMVDGPTALAQFQDMRPCWVDPLSASGYVLPAGLLKEYGINTAPAVLTQNHPAVVRALYVKGICDFGATYAISGDPRTASAVQEDLPDATDRVIIIWRTDPVIPNLNLSFIAGLSESNRLDLTNAFLDLAKTPEGKSLLSLSAGNYQIEEVKVVEDDIYDPLRQAAEALEADLREFIGK